MDIQEFNRQIKKKQSELEDLFRRKMPVFSGRIAKDHFQDNFRKGGFVNNGLRKWPVSKRQQSGSESAAANYGTLLSGRNHLFSNVAYYPGDGKVKISNDLVYAPAHNWGETVNPTVTAKMRKFAWAKYYNSGGGKKGTEEPEDAKRWKALALTKKQKLTIKLPQRQFIGESAELTQKINDKTDLEVRKILNS